MADGVLLEVDSRRRLNLNKIGRHDRYTAVEHEDGSITLTPAIILSPADLHYLGDNEIQGFVSDAQENTGRTVRRVRGTKTGLHPARVRRTS
jgi:hypothetical protein